jgi:hypothetical protein
MVLRPFWFAVARGFPLLVVSPLLDGLNTMRYHISAPVMNLSHGSLVWVNKERDRYAGSAPPALTQLGRSVFLFLVVFRRVREDEGGSGTYLLDGR